MALTHTHRATDCRTLGYSRPALHCICLGGGSISYSVVQFRNVAFLVASTAVLIPRWPVSSFAFSIAHTVFRKVPLLDCRLLSLFAFCNPYNMTSI